jgi:hypothetical protein
MKGIRPGLGPILDPVRARDLKFGNGFGGTWTGNSKSKAYSMPRWVILGSNSMASEVAADSIPSRRLRQPSCVVWASAEQGLCLRQV